MFCFDAGAGHAILTVCPTACSLNPYETSQIDFDFSKPQSHEIQRKPAPRGHVIACRITAENPDAGFKPNSGKVLELNFRSSTNVWGYFSVISTSGIHDFADSQFGHIFAYGETRPIARKNMIVALKELSIRGDFRTTIEYLVTMLEMKRFAENDFDTAWLDGLIANKIEVQKPELLIVVICAAVSKAFTAFEENLSEYRKVLEKGRIADRNLLKTTTTVEFVYEDLKFRFQVARSGPDYFRIFYAGTAVEVICRKLADGGLLILLDGKSHVAYLKEEAVSTILTLDSRTINLEKESDPTKMRSPSSGKLVRFLVEDGGHVNAGDQYAEIEVMKMVMALSATAAGTVTLQKQPGAALQAGDILASLELDDPSAVKQSKPFEGQISFGAPQVGGTKAHQHYRELRKTIELILDGYEGHEDIAGDIRKLGDIMKDPEVFRLGLLEVLSSLTGRIPAPLEEALRQVTAEPIAADAVPTKVAAAEEALKSHVPASAEERAAYDLQTAPIQAALKGYRSGLQGHERIVMTELLERYYNVEKLFDREHTESDVLDKIRQENKNELDKVIAVAMSHSKVSTRNELMLNLLAHVRSDYDGEQWKVAYSPILKKLASLDSNLSVKVAVKARELLIYTTLPTYSERYGEIENTLREALVGKVGSVATANGKVSYSPIAASLETNSLAGLVSANYSIVDVLTSFFYHPETSIRLAALYTYVAHTYVNAYQITGAESAYLLGKTPIFKWDFSLKEVSRDQDALEPIARERNPSVTDSGSETQGRRGVMGAFQSMQELEEAFPLIIRELAASNATAANGLGSKEPTSVNVINLAIDAAKIKLNDDEALAARASQLLSQYRSLLVEHGVRRVTFTVTQHGQFPKYFTFKQFLEYREDGIIRHIEPALAYQLELRRMANFNIRACFGDNRRVHVYLGRGKENHADNRFFVRALVQPGALSAEVRTHDFLASEGERILSDIMDALDVLNAEQSGQTQTDCNNIFINFIPTFQLDEEEVEKTLRGIIIRNGIRLFRLRVTDAEIRFVIQKGDKPATAIRFMISNVTGYIIKIERYTEVKNAEGFYVLQSATNPPGHLHRTPVLALHGAKEYLAPRRYKAHLLGTTFVYDFPNLFRQAVQSMWSRYARKNPSVAVPANVLNYTELALDETKQLREVTREPGANNIAMVAWILELFTPECPEGRKMVVIANDITVNTGSFGTEEDLLFKKASELARRHGYPRAFLSANSGARIGLAEEVKSRFRIAWTDAKDPSKGFRYIYLTQQDMNALRDPTSGNVPAVTEMIQDEGEIRYKITDIIGKQDGLGVENLRGSGMIAGETSLAYKDIFTITLVTARSVGIGAYLVRLGQRAIQVEGQPIILTGSSALNKVLGREVYSSNLQLGGTQIMYKNGISHLTASNDMEGVSHIVRWLSYIPKARGLDLPELIMTPDPIERPVDFEIPSTPYDPRNFLAGMQDGDRWVSGIFDRDSWMESMGGWAPGVVTGRARLGGIPMGVVAVEMRTIQETWPADPGNPESSEQILTSAPQVWMPESAFKTAQAIRDFNNGEQLPLVIFANWRGFSGGQNDLLKGILKFGSYIVDALVDYRQPIFVYVMGELRGGAWVVLDPTINPDFMEMYAETNARGGVLEPEGTVEIKYRKNQIQSTMERLDEDYKMLKMAEKMGAGRPSVSAAASSTELPPVASGPGANERAVDAARAKEIQAKIASRERKLIPVYHQVALHFADLHDTPRRMLAKGVIRGIVDWRDSRRLFYWRLKRRLLEERLVKDISKARPDIERGAAFDVLNTWYLKDSGKVQGIEGAAGLADVPDADAVAWLEAFKGGRKEDMLQTLKKEALKAEVRDLLKRDRSALLEGITSLMRHLTAEEREQLLQVGFLGSQSLF